MTSVAITGATRGLGRAMVDEFIAQGHSVAGCGTNAALIDELRRKYPAGDFEVIDVRDDQAVSRWAETLFSRKTAPSFLLNNAALINDPRPLWEVRAEEFDRIVDVNVKGVANTIRSFVPRMIALERGVIVNFSSGWGRSADAMFAPYCATKFAIEGLTKALAEELPDPLSTVALNPGVIDTDMLRQSFGSSSHSYPSASTWSKRAVPFILSLGRAHNGKSLSVR